MLATLTSSSPPFYARDLVEEIEQEHDLVAFLAGTARRLPDHHALAIRMHVVHAAGPLFQVLAWRPDARLITLERIAGRGIGGDHDQRRRRILKEQLRSRARPHRRGATLVRVALIASLVPAYRALRLDPCMSLDV